jgi:hypothetical protein
VKVRASSSKGRRSMPPLRHAQAPAAGAALAQRPVPLTTYSQNTGVIATTRVASRRVVQVAAVLLLFYGLSPK